MHVAILTVPNPKFKAVPDEKEQGEAKGIHAVPPQEMNRAIQLKMESIGE